MWPWKKKSGNNQQQEQRQDESADIDPDPELFRLLNLHPWDKVQLSSYNDGSVQQVLLKNPTAACAYYTFKAQGRGYTTRPPIYRAIALGSSLRTIQLLVKYNPSVMELDRSTNNININANGDDGGDRSSALYIPKQMKQGVDGGSTPLHAACASAYFPSSVEIINYLIELCPMAVTVTTKYGYTPLHNACQYYKHRDNGNFDGDDKLSSNQSGSNDDTKNASISSLKQLYVIIQRLVHEYPDALHMKNKLGYTPYDCFVHSSSSSFKFQQRQRQQRHSFIINNQNQQQGDNNDLEQNGNKSQDDILVSTRRAETATNLAAAAPTGTSAAADTSSGCESGHNEKLGHKSDDFGSPSLSQRQTNGEVKNHLVANNAGITVEDSTSNSNNDGDDYEGETLEFFEKKILSLLTPQDDTKT